MFASLALAVALTAAPPSAPSPLVGRWEGNPFTFSFEANGAGSFGVASEPPESFTWKVQGAKLLVSSEGETTTYDFAVSGDALTLSGGDLPGALRLTRAAKGAAAAGKKGLIGKKLEEVQAPAAPAGPAFPMAGAQAPAGKATAPAAAPKVTGTCQGACTHTLQCVGQLTPNELQACVVNCSQGVPDPQRLAATELMSCDQVAAMLMQAAAAQRGGGRGGGNGRKECQGCVRDGNDCVWISQSDWGHGPNSPYSGAVSSCDPSCCQ